MPESFDWTVTTYAGNRQRQRDEFRTLTFREKLSRIEQLGEVAAYFTTRRSARDQVVGRGAGVNPVRNQTATEHRT